MVATLECVEWCLRSWLWYAFPWWLVILSFHKLIIHSYVFGEMSVQILSPFKNVVKSSLYILDRWFENSVSHSVNCVHFDGCLFFEAKSLKFCPIYFFLFSLVLLVSHLRSCQIQGDENLFLFFSKNSVVLVQTLRFFDPFFPVNFCVWYEVGVQRHYLWIKKTKVPQFFKELLSWFFF